MASSSFEIVKTPTLSHLLSINSGVASCGIPKILGALCQDQKDHIYSLLHHDYSVPLASHTQGPSPHMFKVQAEVGITGLSSNCRCRRDGAAIRDTA